MNITIIILIWLIGSVVSFGIDFYFLSRRGYIYLDVLDKISMAVFTSWGGTIHALLGLLIVKLMMKNKRLDRFLCTEVNADGYDVEFIGITEHGKSNEQG